MQEISNVVRSLEPDHWGEGLAVIRRIRHELEQLHVWEILPPTHDISHARQIYETTACSGGSTAVVDDEKRLGPPWEKSAAGFRTAPFSLDAASRSCSTTTPIFHL